MKTNVTKISSEVLDNLIRIYLTRHYELQEYNREFCYLVSANNGMAVKVELTYKPGTDAPKSIILDLKMLKSLLVEAVMELGESKTMYYRRVANHE
ncbi:hypothetical protein [Helicobacter pylori]|uniref:hypothetical protein n=1 Tax=Helicobacter pylori TaxID=210 RepID=UPI00165C90E3|nr:hypothetical protein [Helicobacter pylori]MBH0241105.1 hypothetical protein [Helicobacter pylori]